MCILKHLMNQTWLQGSERVSRVKAFIHSLSARTRESGSIQRRAASGKTSCGGGGQAVHLFFKVFKMCSEPLLQGGDPSRKHTVPSDCLIACLLCQREKKDSGGLEAKMT